MKINFHMFLFGISAGCIAYEFDGLIGLSVVLFVWGVLELILTLLEV